MTFDPLTLAKPVEDFDHLALATPVEDSEEFDPLTLAKPVEESLSTRVRKAATGYEMRKAIGLNIEDAFSAPPSLATRMESLSERQSDQESDLVPGVPLRKDFVEKTKSELLQGGSLAKESGVVARTQEALLESPAIGKDLAAVAKALGATPVPQDIGPLGTLREGLKATGRSIGAAKAIAEGDEEGLQNLRDEQMNAPKNEALQALLTDMQDRVRKEDSSIANSAKSLFEAAAWNPSGMAHSIIEQTPNALAPLTLGAAGAAVGGIPGGIAGLFGGNVLLSTGFRALEEDAQREDTLKKGLIEGAVITGVDIATLGTANYILGTARRAVESATRQSLVKAGVNASDPAALKLALESPEILASVKAAQVAAYGAATTLGKRLTRGSSAVGLDALGEGTGAYLGKLAADGKASQIEAMHEALSGAVSSGVTAAGLAAVQQKETGRLMEKASLAEEAKTNVTLAEALSAFPEVREGEQIVAEPIPEMTPAEEHALHIQKVREQEGTALIPDDPDALEEHVGLDEMMLDPLYKQPGEWETAVGEHMKKDMDAGISEVVARRRALEAFPDMTPMTRKPITWSSASEQVGLNLSQAKVPKGGVVVIGGMDEQFSPAYTQALGSTIQEWATRFLGKEEKVIINLSGLKGTAVGGYQQTPSGIHVISPRELVRTNLSERYTADGVTLDVAGPGQPGYNIFTQQQTFGGVTHEFGHALTMGMFNAAMPQQHLGVVGKLDSGAIYGEHQLAEMPQAEAAVIREYQELKARILSKEMSAEELVEKWLGAWKIGKDLMKHQKRDLYSHAKEALFRDAKLLGKAELSSLPLSQISGLDLIHAMGRETETEAAVDSQNRPTTRRLVPDAKKIADSNRRAEAYYLQFNEYMAEQFSRYAHAKEIDKGTALGTYFRSALKKLREFFRVMKTSSGQSGTAMIAPGTSFQQWVDQLHHSRALSVAEAARRRKNALRFKARMEAKLKEFDSPKKIIQKVVAAVQHKETKAPEGESVEDLEALAEDKAAKEDLKERIRTYLPDLHDPARKELMALVAKGRLQEAEDQLADIVEERVKAAIGGGYEQTPDGSKTREILEKLGDKKMASLWAKAVNFTADFGIKLVQLQQLAHETSDRGLKAFVFYQNSLTAMKNNLLRQGMEVAQVWEDLSQKDQQLMDSILMAELKGGAHQTVLMQDPGTGRWKHSAGEGFLAFLQSKGVDTKTPEGERLGQLIIDMKNSILQHVQVVEATAVEIIRSKYGKNPLVAKQKEIEIRKMAQEWRSKPFVPQGHYGNFVVKVFEGIGDERRMVYRSHFDNAADQDALVKKLKGQGLDVQYGKIDEETGINLILPTEFLSVLADSGEFSSEQLSKIGDAMLPLHAEKAFKTFSRDAEQILGASTDRLRDYVNWIEDSANFTAKLTYGRKLTMARVETRAALEEQQALGNVQEARSLQRILDAMSKTQEFIMHPLEEWFKTRSFVALTYLMWAPKTALMNITGLFQTWAAMTADYGDIKGNALMAKSTKDLMTGKLSFDENWAMNKALEDGLIDQGFGYFMSGLANAGNLARRVRPTMLGKAGRAFVDLGMFPFKAVETGNRKLTFLSVYRAESERLRAEGKSPDEAMRTSYARASAFTRLLQNDYASGNRPEILRGKKSILMIFLSYPQYMLWLMSGGFERGVRNSVRAEGGSPRAKFGGMTMRMWLIFLSLSGIEGVPFGQAILDILQQLWKAVGGNTNIRLEGQRFLKETAGVESAYWRNVMQRGFLHDVLGADLSGSYSLGSPLPGLGLINPHARNWQEFVGEAFGELAGPFGGVVKAPLAIGLDQNLTAGDVGKAVPGALGAVARAVEAERRGVRSSKKERILRDEEGNFRDPTKVELAMIASGFRLADVAEFQQIEALKRERIEYWNGRRTGLKQQYRQAVEDRDSTLREDVQKEIDAFNKEIPSRNLRLSGKELWAFVRTSRNAVRKLEQDRYPAKTSALQRDVDRVMR